MEASAAVENGDSLSLSPQTPHLHFCYSNYEFEGLFPGLFFDLHIFLSQFCTCSQAPQFGSLLSSDLYFVKPVHL